MQKSPQQIQKKKAKVSYHKKPSPSFFFCKKKESSAPISRVLSVSYQK